MNPWATADGGDGSGERAGAPYRVSLGGIKAFVSRQRLNEAPGLCVDTSAYSSTQLVDKIDQLVQLKTTALERVRELERTEAQVASGGLLLPRALEAKLEAVRALRGDLEELLAMKSVLLRTLQKNVASEYLDLEMQHQRTFIDLFLKLSDELPRYASSAVAAAGSASSVYSGKSSNTSGATSQSQSQANMAHDVRERHKEYEVAVSQCKATIAKFHLIRDDMARVRAAYSQLHQVTVNTAESPAFAG